MSRGIFELVGDGIRPRLVWLELKKSVSEFGLRAENGPYSAELGPCVEVVSPYEYWLFVWNRVDWWDQHVLDNVWNNVRRVILPEFQAQSALPKVRTLRNGSRCCTRGSVSSINNYNYSTFSLILRNVDTFAAAEMVWWWDTLISAAYAGRAFYKFKIINKYFTTATAATDYGAMKKESDRRETMKKFTFKGVLDNFRTSVAQQQRPDQEIQETLRPENFQVKRVSSSQQVFW